MQRKRPTPRLPPGSEQRAWVLCVAGALLAASLLGAQETPAFPRPTLVARPLNPGTPLRLDGLLDEPGWTLASAVTDFRQREPSEGSPASEETEVRVLYDAQSLYVGILARDREPGRIVARVLQRDRVMELDADGGLRFAGDDAVAILFDTFHDHRNGVVFATNPNGAEFDALITDEGRDINANWRGVWTVAARRLPEGWSAEFSIPFRTLRYPADAGSQTWGFNVYRIVRRKNEEDLLSSWSRDGSGFTRVSRAGELQGLFGLPSSVFNVEVKPFALTGLTRRQAEVSGPTTWGESAAGLEVKFGVRRGLTLDATANTDFAQVEVDEQQVNLTRFGLFFPEKREFFLENAGVFTFGARTVNGGPPPFLLFFSRRIGISDSGEVPLIGGARVTGRAGAQMLGLLDVVTDHAFGEARTNYAVLRVKRDAGGGYIGGMITDRRSTVGANTALGGDLSVWPARTINVQGFAVRTLSTGPGGDGDAYGLSVDYEGDRTGFLVQQLIIAGEAKAGMGFVNRNGIRRADVLARLTLRPNARSVRRIDFWPFAQYIAGPNGRALDWFWGPSVAFEWQSGETLYLWYEPAFTRLEEGFTLADRISIPAGDYHTWQFGCVARTSRARPLAMSFRASLERFYDGRLVTVGGDLRAAAGTHLGATLAWTRDAADMPWGAFRGDLVAGRLSYAFSRRLNVSALAQYNSLHRTVSANLRANLIYRTGSDIFLVLNEERGSATSPWAPRSRGLVLKISYLARL